MKLTDEELGKLLPEIKEECIKELKRRAVERILRDNAERIEKHIARLSSEIAPIMEEKFPL